MKKIQLLVLAVLLIVPAAISNQLNDGPDEPPICQPGQSCGSTK